MTVRENVHHLVDTVPEEHLNDLLDYLAELGEADEELSAETLAGIREGLEDIGNGHTNTLEEYRRTRDCEVRNPVISPGTARSGQTRPADPRAGDSAPGTAGRES